ncbi:hypothetical protein BA190_09505 [Labrys sp. WJW]|uniref:hypothetical protein n=1 Tax=Labrys sp. WJW TaxID=1737983 RepID=UPI000833E785|nr:hypothetical protein [Labrys sp. WJW]OCC05142.1 hypothetical protein BA190_09505 [Labrys sp. WJW]
MPENNLTGCRSQICPRRKECLRNPAAPNAGEHHTFFRLGVPMAPSETEDCELFVLSSLGHLAGEGKYNGRR